MPSPIAARSALLTVPLTILGVAGTALTLFAGLDGVLTLARSMKALLAGWKAFAVTLWRNALALLGVDLSAPAAAMLSFVLFALVLAIGARLRNAVLASATVPSASRDPRLVRLALGAIAGVGVCALGSVGLYMTFSYGYMPAALGLKYLGFSEEASAEIMAAFILLVPSLFLVGTLWCCYTLLTWPVAHAQRLFGYVAVYAGCVCVQPILAAMVQVTGGIDFGLQYALETQLPLMVLTPLIVSMVFAVMMRIAPPLVLRTRLLTSLAGTAGLAALNELLRWLGR